jgi:hypothetical protein
MMDQTKFSRPCVDSEIGPEVLCCPNLDFADNPLESTRPDRVIIQYQGIIFISSMPSE